MSIKHNQVPSWILWLFAIFLTVITPLIYSSSTVDITLVPQLIALASILLLSIILFFIFGKQYSYSILITPFCIVLFAYFLFSLTSLFGAINFNEGLFELLKIGLWITLFIMIVQLLNNGATKAILFKTLIVSSAVLSVIGLMQLADFAFTSIPGHVIPYGTLGNRNIFIPSLLMTLPFVVHEVVASSSKKWKALAIFSLILNLFVVIASEMRTVWIALFVAMFILGVILIFNLNIFNIKLLPKWIKLLKGAMLVFMIIGIAGAIIFYNLSVEKIKAGTLLSMSSINERVALWKNSFEMFKEHPLNGVGVGNWKVMFPYYGLSELPREVQIAEMHYQRPENDFIWVLSETGILGFISYVSVFVLGFVTAYKRILNATTTSEKTTMLLMIGALILYCVIAFFGFPKERTFLSIELAIVLAIIFSKYYSENKKIRKISMHSSFFFAFLLVCIYFGNKLYAGELYTRKIIDARTKNLHQKVIHYSDKALQKGYNIDPAATPIVFYRGVAFFSLGKLDEAMKDFEAARILHPNHLHVLNNLATCYESKREHEKAIQCLWEALKISPNFKDALINLSAIYYNAGNIEKANEFISKVSTDNKTIYYLKVRSVIDRKINDSLLILAKNYYNSGNMQRAKETLLKCKRNTNNKEYQKLKSLLIKK